MCELVHVKQCKSDSCVAIVKVRRSGHCNVYGRTVDTHGIGGGGGRKRELFGGNGKSQHLVRRLPQRRFVTS